MHCLAQYVYAFQYATMGLTARYAAPYTVQTSDLLLSTFFVLTMLFFMYVVVGFAFEQTVS
jgi:hypothetical protein